MLSMPTESRCPAWSARPGPLPASPRRWAGRRGVAATLTSAERIYEVRDLRFPAGVDGTLRRAAEADRERLLSWLPGFEAGTGWAGSDPAAVFVTRRLAAGDVWIWDDDGPVSMAARTEAVAGVSRIQAVNTPPELRARGYASAGVAALSARVLAAGPALRAQRQREQRGRQLGLPAARIPGHRRRAPLPARLGTAAGRPTNAWLTV